MTLSVAAVYVILIISYIGLHIGLWGVFKKAGVNPILSLIPIYDYWIWLRKVLSRPWWWMIFILFPFIGVFMFFMMVWKTIRLFGKTSYLPLILGTMFFCLYLPYLGWSKKEQYTRLADLKPFVKSKAREWGDAIIFAVAAAYIIRMFLVEFYAIPTSSMESTLMVGDYLAVGKMDFGARVPMTPIAVPFVHHTLPGTKTVKSYSECVELPYMKFPALRPLRRYDIVVFNYPDGDTVALERQSESYYAIVREFEYMLNPQTPKAIMESLYYKYSPEMVAYYQSKYPGAYYEGKGRAAVKQEYKVVSRPVDKRENYVKRCVAMPGDKIKIVNSELFINGKTAFKPERMQYSYFVTDPSGIGLTPKKRKELNINEEDVQKIDAATTVYWINEEQKKKIEKLGLLVEKIVDKEGVGDPNIFPHDTRYAWNKDNFGELTVPKKGETVEINDSTIVLYAQIIKNYELNDLKVVGDKVYINGKEAHEYTFKMNYYFMMGDNRHNSADSRFWGFVPENHIVGRTLFVWLSLDKFKNFGDGKIRWNKMFKSIQ